MKIPITKDQVELLYLKTPDYNYELNIYSGFSKLFINVDISYPPVFRLIPYDYAFLKLHLGKDESLQLKLR